MQGNDVALQEKFVQRNIFAFKFFPLRAAVTQNVHAEAARNPRRRASNFTRSNHTERLAVEAGQPFTFDRVLLVNNDGQVTVGAPAISGARVTADVVEHIRGDKKIIFKMKRRKGSHKKQGHRQELTVVKVTEIKA